MVVVIIHHVQPAFSRIAGTFVLAPEILFVRIDVGIAVVDSGAHPFFQQCLDYGAAARCTASMEQKFQSKVMVSYSVYRKDDATRKTAKAIIQAMIMLFTALAMTRGQL